MADRVAQIIFKSYAEPVEYSYFTDIEDLKKGDVLVVPTSNAYSIGYFSKYSTNKHHIRNASKWIVQKVDIEAYEDKLFLGGFN